MMNLQFPEISLARAAFASGKCFPLEYRLLQLQNFAKIFEDEDMRNKIYEAMYKDLRKSPQEVNLCELVAIRMELKYLIANLRSLAVPKQYPRRLFAPADKSFIRHDPHGVVLVLGTWNYPFYISFMPMIGAIAAGNCVVLKPSEIAEHSAHLMYQIVTTYLDNECYHVILGDAEKTKWLLTHRFDYIFFTGSTQVGRCIMQMAALHLTPVTLELGGKSPLYMDRSGCCKFAVARILWGKILNMGQTCVAPDYIICSKEVEKEFVRYTKDILLEWFGQENSENLQRVKDLPRIINVNHFRRLRNLLEHTRGTVLLGGHTDEKDLWIEPTLIGDINTNDPLMEGEIFGPILPFITLENLDHAIRFIRAFERPLALYIFSKNQRVIDKILNSTQSGGVCVNDTIIQVADHRLPFGGTGQSGFGQYHGSHSFHTFTHPRTVVIRSLTTISEKLADLRYPPLPQKTARLIENLALLVGDAECTVHIVLKYVFVLILGYAICWCKSHFSIL